METVGAIVIFLVIFFLALVIISIYLTYKIIQFIVVSVNLYKEMVQNQKKMIELLKLNVSPQSQIELNPSKPAICPSCGAQVEVNSKFCVNCGFTLKG